MGPSGTEGGAVRPWQQPTSRVFMELTERAPEEDVEKRLVAVHHAIRIRENRMGPFRLDVPGLYRCLRALGVPGC